MSGSERPSSPRDARALDAIVAEAKEHLDHGSMRGHEIDWARLESRIVAQASTDALDGEKPALLRDLAPTADGSSRRARRRDVILRTGALALASAAAIALFVYKERASERPAVAVVAPRPALGASERSAAIASSLRSIEGSGAVRVNQVELAPGGTVHAADTIEVAGARAVFERAEKVVWVLEGRSAAASTARAQVKSAGTEDRTGERPLVLALEDGAIEAQVTPIPQGEAFAVDLATERNVVRVAVHGTHLRVTRSGDRVSVDLTEGVVSIGVPPRVGITLGTLVTAPAHVELDATDLQTLRIDHGPDAVRAAIPLAVRPVTPVAIHETPALPGQPALAPSAPPAVPLVSSSHGAVARPAEAAPSPPLAAPKKAKVPPREVIASAVRECAAARSRSGEVHVTVTSDLHLRVSPAGEVLAAQFDPPLLPEIQTCAAYVIYKTKLDETGTVTVPIEFSF